MKHIVRVSEIPKVAAVVPVSCDGMSGNYLICKITDFMRNITHIGKLFPCVSSEYDDCCDTTSDTPCP